MCVHAYVSVVEELAWLLQLRLTCSVCHSAVAMASQPTHPDTAMWHCRRRAAKFTRHPKARSDLSCQSFTSSSSEGQRKVTWPLYNKIKNLFIFKCYYSCLIQLWSNFRLVRITVDLRWWWCSFGCVWFVTLPGCIKWMWTPLAPDHQTC